jgi:hypothetical protein
VKLTEIEIETALDNALELDPLQEAVFLRTLRKYKLARLRLWYIKFLYGCTTGQALSIVSRMVQKHTFNESSAIKITTEAA